MENWTKTIDQIAKDLHSGKKKPTDLNKDYILKTGKVLSDGITEGYGKVKYNTSDIKNIASLQKNAYLFSTYKNVAFQEKIASYVNDKDGKLRSFFDFKKDVLKVDKTYNQTYLQAEYQTAVRSAQATKQWEDIVRRSKRYPNLEYKTVGDNHVREEHTDLNGQIRPINHSFWNTYYPPNGWRCRCYVVSTNNPANGDDVPAVDKKTVPEVFRHNVGNSKQAFPLAIHPYSKNLKKLRFSDIHDFVAKKTPFQKFENFKNGSTLMVSPFSDVNDFYPNLFSMIKIAKSEKNSIAEVMHHLMLGKNPELRFNGIIGDRVESVGFNSVKNTFQGSKSKYGKNGQLKSFEKSFVLFDFQDTKLTNNQLEKIARLINGKMQQFKRNKFNFFIINNEVIKVDDTMNIKEIRTALKVQKTN